MRRFILAVVFACLGVASQVLAADEWPRFRGPNGAGLGVAPGVAAAWTDANFLWTVELGGYGHGSPIVWGERLFVTTGDPATGGSTLVAIDAMTGGELWRQEQPGGERHLHAANSYASTTPAADGDRVYLTGATPAGAYAAAYTHDGAEVWRRSLGPFECSHGFGGSPVVVGGVVCFADDQAGESAIVGLDAASGEVAWRLPRPSGKAAYSTPCVVEGPSGPAIVVQSMSAGMAAVDAATGEELWRLPDVFPHRCVSSPVLAGGLLLGACGGGGSGKRLVAVGAAGTPEAESYTLRRGVPYVPTPLVIGDLVFLWHDRGTVACVDRATGEPRWQERIGGAFFSSPVGTGDAVLSVSRDGEVVAIAVDGAECRVLGRTPLGEPCHATPAIAHGRLYVRTASKLYCVAGVETASVGGSASDKSF